MQKAHKDLLRALVADLRHTLQGSGTLLDTPNGDGLRGDLDRELERIGIGRNGVITPLDALPNPTPHDVRAHRTAEVQLANLPKPERPAPRAEIVERAAYTWINRLLALRTMEARGLIEETLRANPAYEGISEALYLLRYEAPQRTAGADGGWWAVVEDACQAQAQILPGLFDLNDPNAALRPSTAALLRCLQIVGRPELDSVFVDPDVISWSYQFYQEEAKGRIYTKLNRGGKVETRSEIASATQFFTEPYMVRWLLQNSMGRSYHEAYPNSALPQSWEYYINRESVVGDHGSVIRNGVQSPLRDRESGSRERLSQSPVTNPQSPFSLSDLTFMDPCTGSGHFQREAFDLLFAMYCEQHPTMDARAIADRILTHHLHGIDIDPRAVQLAAVTLVLRAWETVGGPYRPPALNLATTPSHLDVGALDRHLQRHPEDSIYRPILQGVFIALVQAPLLGSLLKPEEHLDAILQEFRKQNRDGQTGLLAEDEETNRLLAELARHDPGELKKLLLERIARSFAREAKESDVAALLLGREAGEGLHLLQLLNRKYAVVATNPPYTDNTNLDLSTREYLEAKYSQGKRNLYAAFIVRALELVSQDGFAALVTPLSYLFNKEFTALREQILVDTVIVSLASLGRHAFSEVDPPANPILAVYQNTSYGERVQPFRAFRLSAPRPAEVQARLLQDAVAKRVSGLDFVATQTLFVEIPGKPLAFWLSPELLRLFQTDSSLDNVAHVKEGLGTREDKRFVRYNWEAMWQGDVWTDAQSRRWYFLAKAGGYRKWAGLTWFSVDWQFWGARLRAFPKSAIRNDPYYFLPGFTYSMMGRGKLSTRILDNEIFNDSAPSVFLHADIAENSCGVLSLLNSRLLTYVLRVLTQSNQFRPGYMRRTPITIAAAQFLDDLGRASSIIKKLIVNTNILERTFCMHDSVPREAEFSLSTYLHLIEGVIEKLVCDYYALPASDVAAIVEETGAPSGWYPMMTGYDRLPNLSTDVELPPLPQTVLDFLIHHERIVPNAEELARIKANLQALYEAGPGARTDDLDLDDLDHHGNDDDEAVSGAYIPIPTETFLEELSIKLQIHPISVYWLLEELRAEGVRCKPEEKRLLEDRLSVIVLRLLGHRWPKQIEAGEPVPAWADRDGVIPLTAGTGESTLADLVRARLRAEDGDLGAQQAEALLYELTGSSLEEWLRGDFFRRHTSQFKRRPIAWHLASSPVAGGRKRTATPAFECIVYYHATGANASLPGRGGDILARIRMQYVDRLLAPAQRDLAQARRDGDETTAARANALILELEDFARRLRQVEEGGFACQALEEVIANEPLDRWAGDGVFAPAGRAEFLAQEEAWQVDINDGVRVNIAPLQEAGLLASDVLARADVTKAIADRARWRADERRWVRQGKLPRCGWMDETVPESPQWTALASEREKERQRLEERRQKVLEELQS